MGTPLPEASAANPSSAVTLRVEGAYNDLPLAGTAVFESFDALHRLPRPLGADITIEGKQTSLKWTGTMTDPSFDARSYGFAKLGDLVKGQPFLETKTVTGASGRGQLWVRLKRRRGTAEAPAENAPAKKTTRKTAKKA